MYLFRPLAFMSPLGLPLAKAKRNETKLYGPLVTTLTLSFLAGDQSIRSVEGNINSLANTTPYRRVAQLVS